MRPWRSAGTPPPRPGGRVSASTDADLVPVAASHLVARVLARPTRAAAVLGAWPRCLYLRLAEPGGDVVVPVCTADALALPGAVRLARPAGAGPAWGVGVGDRVRVGDGRIVRYVPDKQDLLATERKVRALWEAIERARTSGDWRATPSRRCGWCHFKPRCPAWSAEDTATGE